MLFLPPWGGGHSSHQQPPAPADLPDVSLHELGWELRALSSLRQLCMLGLEDKSGLSGSGAARKQHGLPGPLEVKDVQQWLMRPDEGW
jgi:hypothetical protein